MNWSAAFFALLGVGLVCFCVAMAAMVSDPRSGGLIDKSIPWIITISVSCFCASMFIAMLGQAGVIQ